MTGSCFVSNSFYMWIKFSIGNIVTSLPTTRFSCTAATVSFTAYITPCLTLCYTTSAPLSRATFSLIRWTIAKLTLKWKYDERELMSLRNESAMSREQEATSRAGANPVVSNTLPTPPLKTKLRRDTETKVATWAPSNVIEILKIINLFVVLLRWSFSLMSSSTCLTTPIV